MISIRILNDAHDLIGTVEAEDRGEGFWAYESWSSEHGHDSRDTIYVGSENPWEVITLALLHTPWSNIEPEKEANK